VDLIDVKLMAAVVNGFAIVSKGGLMLPLSSFNFYVEAR